MSAHSLPGEDPAAYQREFDSYVEHYQPASEEELLLVQSLLNHVWRIDRVQRLETSVLLKGHLEFAAKYADRPPFERAHLIEAEAYVKYEKQIRNLTIQEGRLRRNREKDCLELARLQAARRHQEKQEPKRQPQQASTPQDTEQTTNGFEFSSHPKSPQPAGQPSAQPPRQAQKRAA